MTNNEIKQGLPAAVVEHLRVLGIQPDGESVTIHAALFDGRWVELFERELNKLQIGSLRAEGATKVELFIPGGGISEFDIKEMVW